MNTKLLKAGIASCVCCLVAGVAVQQGTAQTTSPPVASEATRPPRSDDQAVTSFLQRKKSEQGKRTATLQRRSRAADLAQLRSLYRAAGITPPGANARLSAANQAALAETMEMDILQLLQALDLNPGKVRQLSGGGLDPVTAASAFVRGTSTLEQQALLAELTAVVRVVGVEPGESGDGYGSSVRLEVVEVLAGMAPAGGIVLRQQSSPDLYVSSDLAPSPGQTYVLMLSNEMYRQNAAEAGSAGGGSEAGSRYVLFGSAFGVEGDRLLPTPLSQQASMTLPQLRTALERVKAAKAGSGNQAK